MEGLDLSLPLVRHLVADGNWQRAAATAKGIFLPHDGSILQAINSDWHWLLHVQCRSGELPLGWYGATAYGAPHADRGAIRCHVHVTGDILTEEERSMTLRWSKRRLTWTRTAGGEVVAAVVEVVVAGARCRSHMNITRYHNTRGLYILCSRRTST